MNKVKVDFIAELLNNKRINLSDKERLFALSLNELKKISDTDDEIRKEIEEIKRAIFSNSNTQDATFAYNPQQPPKFNGIFCGKEVTIVADGKTENSFPLGNPSTKEILLELPCIVFYENGIITAKIMEYGSIDKIDKDVINNLEKKIIEALTRELTEYLKSNSPILPQNSTQFPRSTLSESKHSLKESSVRGTIISEKDIVQEGLPMLQNQAELVSFSQQIEENTINQPQQTDLPSYNSPIQLSEFLKAYNQHPILKYTCHEFDEDGLSAVNESCDIEIFNLEIFQLFLANSFRELLNQYKIPKNIWALINVYLNGGKEWASDKVKMNWKSTELLEWSMNNLGVVPNPGSDLIAKVENYGFEFNNAAFKSKMLDRRISSFSQLVIYFKCLFHIRRDNSLKSLVLNVNAKKGWNNKISFDTSDIVENIEFFTDVDKLLQAYEKIIKIIIDISEKQDYGSPIVKISLKEFNNCIIFSIYHENSTYLKTIRNTLERIGQSHSGLIEKQINGLCDLYIQADFGNNEFARINLWNGEERKAEKLSDFKGVEYQLAFK